MTAAPDTGPDSIWVFLIVAAILALVVVVERRREARRRRWQAHSVEAPPCEVIGCDPRPSTIFLTHLGIYACDRCNGELAEVARGFGGAA